MNGLYINPNPIYLSHLQQIHYILLFLIYLLITTNMIYHLSHPTLVFLHLKPPIHSQIQPTHQLPFLIVYHQEFLTSHHTCNIMYAPILETLNHHPKVCFILFHNPFHIIVFLHLIASTLCIFPLILSISPTPRLANMIDGTKLCNLNYLHLRK